MTFRTIEVAGEAALAKLDSYQARFKSSGEYPFLIGDANELNQIKETAELSDLIPSEIILLSKDINIEEWIAKRRSQLEEDGLSADDVLGEWPGERTDKGEVSIHKDVLTGGVMPTVVIGLAGIEEPWQLPAALKYGGWNECPAAEEHCAFHRKWQQEYGARIVGISGDVIECTVANPPSDQSAALRLAWQQFWYCPDIVYQGNDSISNLAATLLNARYWYFWWD